MQPEKSQSAVPAAPNLVLLTDAGAPFAGGEPKVLGLDLVRRTVIAAGRAGYGEIYFLGPDQTAQSGVVVVPDWSSLAAALASHQPAPLIIATATIVAERDWLERLASAQIEPAAWAAIPQRIALLAGPAVPDALAVLSADARAYDVTTVQDRLTRHLGSPAQIPAAIDPMIVTTRADVDLAERRLLRGLVKDTDGFMARHIERPISLQIVRRLASTAVTPNQITVFSVAVGLLGAPFFLSTLWPWQTVGAVLFLAHSILDGCDGELARLKFQESRFGGVIDYWGDNVVHIVVFAFMAVGWSLAVAAPWPLLLGAAAAVGNLGSAWFVYWRVMQVKDDSGPLFTSVSRVPDHRLARLLDAASRRDFIYLVVILALFGKSNWFLILASVGAPIFFFLLIFLAVRERFLTGPTTSRA
jgi:phosphatidylglycerophosphate synthase